MIDEKLIGFDEAKTILADDTSSKGRTFLERVDEKQWRIVLPGEMFHISHDTFKALANSHNIVGDPKESGKFFPA